MRISLQFHVRPVTNNRAGEKDRSCISELPLLPQTSLRRFAAILIFFSELVDRSVVHSVSQSFLTTTSLFFLQPLVCRPLVKILSDQTECQVRSNIDKQVISRNSINLNTIVTRTMRQHISNFDLLSNSFYQQCKKCMEIISELIERS